MNIKTISIEPISGHDRNTGFRKLARVEVFLTDLQMTLREIVLCHDHEYGFMVTSITPKTGQSPVKWVDGSPFAKAIAEAAAASYSSMLAEDIKELKALYKAA
ncbi:hypothetical protein A6U97_05300 [Agrobacterium tumefaciens]|uniref:hypothetical protein n=1 Tax=Agrobacterium tumefaciens TaxID=358 RepID=UPI00080F7E2F|nr:hypothetical protein A6U97_05300 [Agrobacterium tumefaciens]